MTKKDKIATLTITVTLLLCFVLPFVFIEDENTAFMAAMTTGIWLPVVAGFAAADMAEDNNN